MSSSEPKQVATIKILDELNVVVVGLERQHYEHFYNALGFFTKGYIFKPQYKTGRWDGKIRFFNKNGKTSINLLSYIIPDLKHMGYKIKIVDNRSPANVEVPLIDKHYFSDFTDDEGNPIVLGDHQVNGVNALTSNVGGILLAGTGAGKSIAAAALVDVYNKHCNFRCIIIVPNKDLINQTSADISKFNIEVGRYFGDVKEPNAKNVVSTWQSLQNNPTLMSAFDVIIVDECHGAAANVLKDMIVNYGSTSLIRCGLTGTLPKEPAEAMSVTYVLGEVVYEVPASELIELGWLAALRLKLYCLVEDLTPEWNYFKNARPEEAAKTTYKKFKKEFYPDYPAEKTYLQKNKKRIEFIANLVETSVKESGNAFVLVNGIPFGKKLADSIENAYFVYGQDESEVRKKIYALFTDHNDVVVVSTFQLASTGLNIKRIFNLFLIDPGKSFIQIIQSIGRGLRKAKDKDSVNVYDVCSDLNFGTKHMKERIKFYNEQKYNFKRRDIDYANLFDNVDDIVVY
ncbi:helicase [Xanthomonas phage Xoo-sp13]|nr:helicase [Xanthomonas phage Xoo-sp13]